MNGKRRPILQPPPVIPGAVPTAQSSMRFSSDMTVWNPTERIDLDAKETRLMSQDWVAVRDGVIHDGLVCAEFTRGEYLLAQVMIDGAPGDFFRIKNGTTTLSGDIAVRRGQRVQIFYTAIEPVSVNIGAGFLFA